MTQEFEEWAKEEGYYVMRQDDGYLTETQYAYAGWKARGEHDKAKLLSDEVVHKTAKALAVEAYHTFGLETLHNTNADDHAEKEFTHYISPAKAALEAIVRELCTQ